MLITSHDIEKLVAAELAKVSQPDLVVRIRELLVPIRCEQRSWDYDAEGLKFPCWIIAEHISSNTALAYCEQGFGPENPWGLLFICGKNSSIGMDSGWFATLEDTFRESFAWAGVNPPGYEVN